MCVWDTCAACVWDPSRHEWAGLMRAARVGGILARFYVVSVASVHPWSTSKVLAAAVGLAFLEEGRLGFGLRGATGGRRPLVVFEGHDFALERAAGVDVELRRVAEVEQCVAERQAEAGGGEELGRVRHGRKHQKVAQHELRAVQPERRRLAGAAARLGAVQLAPAQREGLSQEAEAGDAHSARGEAAGRVQRPLGEEQVEALRAVRLEDGPEAVHVHVGPFAEAKAARAERRRVERGRTRFAARCGRRGETAQLAAAAAVRAAVDGHVGLRVDAGRAVRAAGKRLD
mmetsp:Transcript_11187/g.37300  ORF Transcript_11187/g.37300 Transcript_11187/m.37300 type:complete len:287 (+) Transcript_11187:130-990(+)